MGIPGRKERARMEKKESKGGKDKREQTEKVKGASRERQKREQSRKRQRTMIKCFRWLRPKNSSKIDFFSHFPKSRHLQNVEQCTAKVI